MTTRRTILRYAGAALAMAGTPLRAATLPTPTQAALQSSDLIYISPLRRDATESSCHAEVWFAVDGTDVFVVTSSSAWRARAIKTGLDRARLWVGEYGNWKSAKEAYLTAPTLLATGAYVTDSARQRAVLERFGDKYSLEWIVWGPRFRNGIADGSRVMLQYSPTA